MQSPIKIKNFCNRLYFTKAEENKKKQFCHFFNHYSYTLSTNYPGIAYAEIYVRTANFHVKL